MEHCEQSVQSGQGNTYLADNKGSVAFSLEWVVEYKLCVFPEYLGMLQMSVPSSAKGGHAANIKYSAEKQNLGNFTPATSLQEIPPPNETEPAHRADESCADG